MKGTIVLLQDLVRLPRYDKFHARFLVDTRQSLCSLELSSFLIHEIDPELHGNRVKLVMEQLCELIGDPEELHCCQGKILHSSAKIDVSMAQGRYKHGKRAR